VSAVIGAAVGGVALSWPVDGISAGTEFGPALVGSDRSVTDGCFQRNQDFDRRIHRALRFHAVWQREDHADRDGLLRFVSEDAGLFGCGCPAAGARLFLHQDPQLDVIWARGGRQRDPSAVVVVGADDTVVTGGFRGSGRRVVERRDQSVALEAKFRIGLGADPIVEGEVVVDVAVRTMTDASTSTRSPRAASRSARRSVSA
jgi:hypothetical protein